MLLSLMVIPIFGAGIALSLPLDEAPSSILVPRAPWQPAVGSSWQIVLSQTLITNAQTPITPDVDVYDIDMFSHMGTNTIQTLHKLNKKVICYFSAGSYEPRRPDSESFPQTVLGSVIKGWPDEMWLDVSSPAVRAIMAARILIASQMGCDAIDPDNVDGFSNKNGLGLTKQHAIDFIKFLASEAGKYNMGIGLKNALDIIPDVLPYIQFAVNEQCAQYNECSVYESLIQAGKPVFHIEYADGKKSKRAATAAIESRGTSAGSSTITRLGCFFDSKNSPVLNGDSDEDDNMTLQMCQEYCSDYRYFGLEKGYKCFCANKADSLISRPDNECNSACQGDPHQTCGAKNRLEIYQRKRGTTASNQSPTTTTGVTRTSTTVKPQTTSVTTRAGTSTKAPTSTSPVTTTRTTTKTASTTTATRATTTSSKASAFLINTAQISGSNSNVACASFKNTNGFSTVIKKLSLDGWVQFCNGQTATTAAQ